MARLCQGCSKTVERFHVAEVAPGDLADVPRAWKQEEMGVETVRIESI